MYRRHFKRILDLCISLVVLLLIYPVFIIISIGLILGNRNFDIFFLQQRSGKDGKIFRIFKFKTMSDKKNVDGNLLSDEQRLTKIGKFVRSTSLDELPQLLNVLKGDMSLIGPRPLLVQYLPLYTKEQSRRHSIRPGITGWAQVNGRNTISWEKKFEYDVWYVDNISLFLDLKIYYLTIKKVFIREGINSESSVTTEAFKGN
jgi:undecaprenyl phosphate N,N'-diacetylbacillosamine 1-phosphate transferase